jgi:peptide/nickel transport system substrate-binding protein
MTHRFALPIVSLLFFATPSLSAQVRAPDTGTLVIGVAREAVSPIPTLWANDNANREVSDLLFLRLADLGPQLITADESKFVPRLARKWSRPDSLTLVFELDPRARWHDGKPVVAGDVVFALDRARVPKYGSSTATQLRRITSVTADGASRVVVRFSQPYAEQFYDVVYHIPPLPSHLLSAVNPDSLRASAFMSAPVGNGPYRFVRREPGQRIELEAVPDFFLGKPKVTRVIFQAIGSADARANMLQAGELDALDNVFQLPDPALVKALPDYRYYPAPGGVVAYVSFNHRNPADTSKPHPILSDLTVRRALVIALDREKLVQATLGPYTHAPSAPVSPLVARSAEPPPAPVYNLAEAKRLLASRGWKDSNGDGVLDKDGTEFNLRFIVPASSAYRRLIAAQIQEAYRGVGIGVTLISLEGALYMPRRTEGNFDLEFWAVNQDPTPTGLVASWSCNAPPAYNAIHYCNPIVDSLLDAGTVSRKPAPAIWREVTRRIADDYPAIFIGGLVYWTPVHRRFEKVTLRPESQWADVWKWSVKPGAQIARDRQ